MHIYLIPSPLGESSNAFFSAHFREVFLTIDYFFVENERTARRYISSLETGRVIQELILFRLTKNTSYKEVAMQFMQIPAESNVGVISEAGCPGIADPGALVAQYAHEKGFKVTPLPGPSSIFLALMASGFSGQQFAFHGYLPQEKAKRQHTLQRLEEFSAKVKQTQIFMETPYRNDALLEDILRKCQPHTSICLAAGLHTEHELIQTKTVREWKNSELPKLHKIPTIFLLYAVT